jgi:hypothetical protein
MEGNGFYLPVIAAMRAIQFGDPELCWMFGWSTHQF